VRMVAKIVPTAIDLNLVIFFTLLQSQSRYQKV
jgi:hypothetical protein